LGSLLLTDIILFLNDKKKNIGIDLTKLCVWSSLSTDVI